MALSLLGGPLETFESALEHPFFQARRPLCRCDIYETDKDIVVEAEIPGVPKENVKVEIDGDMLRISGESRKERETRDEQRRFYVSERSYGNFSRSFTLPDTVDTNKIRAEHRHGCLEIRVPKKQPRREQAKTIQIQSQ
jgi:HSP20 family protein